MDSPDEPDQPRIVSFDLDGTLLPETTVSVLTARHLGYEAELRSLEERYRRHEISNTHVADASGGWYEGVRLAEIERQLDEAPWIDGLDPTVTALRERGSHVLLGTVTWKFAAEILGQWHGFDAVSGTEMGVTGGVLTGEVTRHFDEHDKLAFVREYCETVGASLSDCVAVGDSRSDVPLFEQAGFSIAVNATPDARGAADVHIETDDLGDVLRAIS